MIKRALMALVIAGYWFIGGYIFAWWTPYALQAGWLCVTVGLVLFAWAHAILDRGGNLPMPLGCALVAPPLSLMLIGVIFWLLERFVSPLLPD